MPQPTPVRRAQPTPALSRPSARRHYDEQRRETARRMRRVVTWLRCLQSR